MQHVEEAQVDGRAGARSYQDAGTENSSCSQRCLGVKHANEAFSSIAASGAATVNNAMLQVLFTDCTV